MTATMLETFDTQMLDYPNDLEFSMQVSSSDAWFQNETVMDDGQHLHLENNPSVEVDMEPFDEDHTTEYEMADGSEEFDLGEVELTDVEVYDASQVHSPHSTEVLDGDAAPQTPVLNHHPAYSSERSSSSVDRNPNTIITSAPLNHSPQEGAVTDITFPFDGADEVEAGFSSLPPLVEVDSTADITEENNVVEFPHGEELHTSIDDSSTVLPAHVEAAITDHHTHGVNAETTTQDTPEEQGAHNESKPAATPLNDPHEISEGVYIDPPPPVLLSFSHTDHPEISLFNPLLGSEFTTPNITVLLAQYPTLYYEPLSSVFEALRQEDYAPIQEIIDDEMILDAYDLRLDLSEDNIHAREISLHDLNVLHDGLNISGPLRLRVQATPRFIVRYNILQAQVAQVAQANEILDHEKKRIQLEVFQQPDQPSTDPEKTTVNTEEIDVQPTEIPTSQAGDKGNDEEVENTHESELQGDTDAQNESRLPQVVTDVGEQVSERVPKQETEFQTTDATVTHISIKESKEHREDADVEDDDSVQGAASRESSHEIRDLSIHLIGGDDAAEVNQGVSDTSQGHTDNEVDHTERESTPDISNGVSEESDSAVTHQEYSPGPDVSETTILDSEENADDTDKQVGSATTNKRVEEGFESTRVEYDDAWDEDLDGEGDPDTTWELEQEASSDHSTTTLSTKTSSKRSMSEFELGEEIHNDTSPRSPGAKRPRVV